MQFTYDPSPQRSPQWFEIKRGKIGASRLDDWMAVSKAKATAGKPLKARLDYEKELMYERQFNTKFNIYINDAMQDGIDYEDFAANEFAINQKVQLIEVGCWYNDFMAVSPDRLVFPEGANIADFENAIGILELKIVRDNTFVDILMNGVPPKHWKQMQAQMAATGLHKGWYGALNFSTKKFVVIEVEYDEEFVEYMYEAVQEQLVTQPFALDKVHDIVQALPSWDAQDSGAKIDKSDTNTTTKGW